jgi:CheY-like chemotaxis protein
MAGKGPSEPPRINLATAQVLIVVASGGEQDILIQILSGYGVRTINRASSGAEALQTLERETYDMIIVDHALSEMDGFELIQAIRRESREANRFAPVILLGGHVRNADVAKARDCGASFVVSKPLSAQVLFDRIIWLARDQRKFVDCPVYAGPDRRFRAFGPPVGMSGRRHDDLSATLGKPDEPNLSQDAIDAMFSPAKASL